MRRRQFTALHSGPSAKYHVQSKRKIININMSAAFYAVHTVSGFSDSLQELDCSNCKYGTFVLNSTIANNEAKELAGGGIANFGGEMLVKYSTIAGNESGKYGGGIANANNFDDAEMGVFATIIAGNVADEQGQEIFNDDDMDVAFNIIGHDDLTGDEAIFGGFDDSYLRDVWCLNLGGCFCCCCWLLL